MYWIAVDTSRAVSNCSLAAFEMSEMARVVLPTPETILSKASLAWREISLPVVTRLTDFGYEVKVHPAWPDYPTADATADAALMNQRLQGYIDTMPSQYYWVHKRFKTRPPGEPQVY